MNDFNMNTIKKVLAALIIVAITMGAALSAHAGDAQKPQGRADHMSGAIIVNGAPITAPGPYVTEGAVMLPVRPIAEALGFVVTWDGGESRVGIGDEYVIWIGRPLLSSDGGLTAREFGPAPELIGGRTYAPLPLFNFGIAGCYARIDEGGDIIINAEGAGGGVDGGNAAARFAFGKSARANQPETVDEFIPVFSGQLARYNKIAPSLWPDNAVADKSAVLEDVDTARLWLISADGAAAALPPEDLADMGITRRERPDDFSFYEGGAYITISERSILDQVGGDKPHVGSYDSILWLTHEGFHKWEQDEKWIKPERVDIPNAERDERLGDIPARAKRNLLLRQLMAAVANPDDPTLPLRALATYEDYKITNADDYALVSYFDRIEGTASYYEVASSLYIFYPDQVRDGDDLARAFAYLAGLGDEYIEIGVVAESYRIGMFACALLDRTDAGWKERIMREPSLTPMELLSTLHIGETLPEPVRLSQGDTDQIAEIVRDRIRFLADRQVAMLSGLKQGAGGLPDADRQGMEAYLEYMLQGFEEMIEILPEGERGRYDDFIDMMKS